MNKPQKHLFSLCGLVIFALFAMASTVSRLNYGTFNYKNQVEAATETKDYILLNDGTKVYGSKLTWGSWPVRSHIKIDDQKFALSDVRGYQANGIYYGKWKGKFMRRIVRGKINVYVLFTESTDADRSVPGVTVIHDHKMADHFAQKGDDGPMIHLPNQRVIKDLVAGCPLAEEMANKTNGELRRAIRADHSYLNEIFETYNNDCKPVTERGAEEQK